MMSQPHQQSRVVLPPDASPSLGAQVSDAGLPLASTERLRPGDIVWIDAAIAPADRLALARLAADKGAHLAGLCLPTADWPLLDDLRVQLERKRAAMLLASPLLGTVAGRQLLENFRHTPPETGLAAVRSRRRGAPSPHAIWTDDVWAVVAFLVALHRDDELAVTGASLAVVEGGTQLLALLRSSRNVLWSIEAKDEVSAHRAGQREAEVELLGRGQVARAQPYQQTLELVTADGSVDRHEWCRSPAVSLLELAWRHGADEMYRQNAYQEHRRAVRLIRALQRSVQLGNMGADNHPTGNVR